MSVIINKINMPPSCMLCMFGRRITREATACLCCPTELPRLDMEEGRPDYCPLESVVHCKECQHWLCLDDSDRKPYPYRGYCGLAYELVTDEDHFCSSGMFCENEEDSK